MGDVRTVRSSPSAHNKEALNPFSQVLGSAMHALATSSDVINMEGLPLGDASASPESRSRNVRLAVYATLGIMAVFAMLRIYGRLRRRLWGCDDCECLLVLSRVISLTIITQGIFLLAAVSVKTYACDMFLTGIG